MKKLIKYILVLSLFITTVYSSKICIPSNANEHIELRWKNSVDENGYPIQILDMTEEEIDLYHISQLKKKCKSDKMQRTGGYIYEYTPVLTLYDTGSSASSYILIGVKDKWGQRESKTYGINVSFSIEEVYKSLTGNITMSFDVSTTVKFDNRYDSKLGLFARLQTKKYLVTVKDKYTGNVISTYYETSMAPISTSFRPVYDKGDTNATLFFVYGENTYNAKVIKVGVTTPITSYSQIETATRWRFPN